MKYRLFLYLGFFLSLMFANNSAENYFIEPLLQNDSWQLISEYDDGIKLYEKQINNSGLKAYRVESLVNISGKRLLQSFESVDQYDIILPSAKNITFDTIEKNDKKILAYQHLDIPIITDRHYFYNFYKSGDEQNYAWWQLIDVPEDIEISIVNKYNLSKPLKLKTGAGVYQVEDIQNGTRVHYSLYLDPEGNIPGFLANAANKSGLINMFRDIINYTKSNQ